MLKNNLTTEEIANEKEAILQALTESTTIGEWAKKCNLSIPTLYKRLEFHEIDWRFKGGRKKGAVKVAKLG